MLNAASGWSRRVDCTLYCLLCLLALAVQNVPSTIPYDTTTSIQMFRSHGNISGNWSSDRGCSICGGIAEERKGWGWNHTIQLSLTLGWALILLLPPPLPPLPLPLAQNRCFKCCLRTYGDTIYLPSSHYREVSSPLLQHANWLDISFYKAID